MTGIAPNHWNACIDIFLKSSLELDPQQRKASIVFHYAGRVENGGHSLHFDFAKGSPQDELLNALKEIGAKEHARILAEAIFLRNDPVDAEEDLDDYVSDLISDLDRRFYRTKPDINEILATYFLAHPDSFPNPIS